MVLSSPHVRALFSILLLAMFLSGCWSGGNTKKVVFGKLQGRVTINGDPLPDGCVVTFSPKAGSSDTGIGIVQGDGNYIGKTGLKEGIVVGEYQVSFSPPPLSGEEQKKKSDDTFGALLSAKNADDLKRVATKVQTDRGGGIIPAIYSTPSTSGLTVTVKKGDNKADFDLKKDAPTK